MGSNAPSYGRGRESAHPLPQSLGPAYFSSVGSPDLTWVSNSVVPTPPTPSPPPLPDPADERVFHRDAQLVQVSVALAHGMASNFVLRVRGQTVLVAVVAVGCPTTSTQGPGRGSARVTRLRMCLAFRSPAGLLNLPGSCKCDCRLPPCLGFASSAALRFVDTYTSHDTKLRHSGRPSASSTIDCG